jgi:hypothetical protein
MKYQDSWNGKLIEVGKRECAARYKIIKSVCGELKQPFSVCDIGANMNYFGIRLIEDFDCRVVSFEFHQFEMREKLVKCNDRLMFLKRKVSLTDMYILNLCCHFDIILALSVIHHLPGSIKEWITEFRKLGDNVIIEVALNDSKRTTTRKEYDIPEDGVIIGYGDSHLLKDFKRPIILFK